jgi:signal transduction histidine kinase
MDRGFPRPFLILEELTEELRRSERAAYEKLIRMMSHEVNNSLGAATSLLQSCLNYSSQIREADRADFESALRVATGRAERLGAFMKELADVVRIPAPNLQPCDVRGLLEGIEAVFRAELARRRIVWQWREDAPLPAIAMDHVQMEQVFVNVLKNAMEAIGEDGTITVRMLGGRSRPRVVIEDSGPGIPPEVRASLFTPFFTTKQDGQGIGLTVVQEILAHHGFECALDSVPGSPTRFTLAF